LFFETLSESFIANIWRKVPLERQDCVALTP